MLRILKLWDSQPQEVVELNNRLPRPAIAFSAASSDLVGYWDLARGRYDAWIDPAHAIVPNPGGIGIRPDFANTYTKTQIGPTYDMDVAPMFGQATVWIADDLGTHTGASFRVSFLGELAASRAYLTLTSVGLTLTSHTSATTAVAAADLPRGLVSLGLALTDAEAKVYVNGQLRYTLSQPALSWSARTDGIGFYGISGVGTEGEHRLLHMARWLGVYDEFAEFATAHPWQLFAPRSIWVPVSVGGGGASTITAAAGVATASTLTASSTAASTPTAAAGAATASTVAASSTAASAIASATGAATASTLTGSAVVAGAITAAAGVATASTLTASSVAAGAITAAAGVATASTLVGTGLTAGASAITPATGAATASTMAGASTAAAAITPAAGVATGQTLVPASTVSSASMTPAAGTTTAATFAASAVAASVAVAAAGASSAQTMAATAQAVAAINAAAGSSVCGTLANADAAIVVLGSLAGSTRKPGAIRSNVQTAARSNRQTAKR